MNIRYKLTLEYFQWIAQICIFFTWVMPRQMKSTMFLEFSLILNQIYLPCSRRVLK
jgi:hypothetical protein